jgi:hypothetical protein
MWLTLRGTELALDRPMRFLLLGALLLVGCGGSSTHSGNGTGGGASGSEHGGSTNTGGSAQGGASSGGSHSTGGANSAGTTSNGSGGSGGSTQRADCGPTLTFRMTPSIDRDTQYCDGGPSACNIEWFSIYDSRGAVVATHIPCGTAPCSTCEAPACPAICSVPSLLSESGREATWNGVRQVVGTCGPGARCLAPECAPAGEYVARFCAYALQGAGGEPSDLDCGLAVSQPTCVDVPFSYPSDGVVEGVLE